MVRAGALIYDVVSAEDGSMSVTRGLIVLAASDSRILARPTDGGDLVSYSANDEDRIFFLTQTACSQECQRRNGLVS